MDEVIFEIRPREAISVSLASVAVSLGFMGLTLFAISPIVFKPVVILATGALAVVSVPRSLRITFVVTEDGVYAANFFRERYATWDTIVRVKKARLVSPVYWPIFFSLGLVIRRGDGSHETFVVSAGLLGLDGKERQIQMIDEVRRHLTAHGVPMDVDPRRLT